jgi:TRAP transporter 4TM/12TM fusion protein
MRQLQGTWAKIVSIVAICASLFHLYTAAFGILDPRLQRGYHLLFLLPLCFLLYPATKKSPQDKVTFVDGILAFLAVLPSIYIIMNNLRLCQRWEHVTPLLTEELILGTIAIILIIEAIRRAVTPVLAYVILGSLLFMAAGPLLPGMFHHRGIAFKGMVEMMYLLAEEGIYGMLTGISATYIFIFVLYGSFVVHSGAGDFFTKLACSVAGRLPGGPALIAIISSAFFGTLSGSSVANVFGTGSFTIPLMKKVGYKPEFAGAVEAAASTGGQYMPPVMGAAAFIMAEIVGVPYITVALSAAISATLYFVSIGLMVYFRARRDGLRGLSSEEVPPFREILQSGYLIIPIIALFYMLVRGYSPIMAGLWAIITTVAITWVNPRKAMRASHILKAMVEGGRNAVLVAVACAGTGIVVSVVIHTGLGLSFSNILVLMARGNIIITMFLIMVAALILGHGAPTSATYVLVSTVGATALTQLGADLIAAHLFCLYYAVIADITPPVAVAAYAGASIAKSEPLSTGIEAFLLASAGFIVPFIFVLQPALVLRGPVMDTLQASISALIGCIALAGAIQGWFMKVLSKVERLILFAAAAALLEPSWVTDVIGLCVLMVFIIKVKLSKAANSTMGV